jgi:hypothetical protein
MCRSLFSSLKWSGYIRMAKYSTLQFLLLVRCTHTFYLLGGDIFYYTMLLKTNRFNSPPPPPAKNSYYKARSYSFWLDSIMLVNRHTISDWSCTSSRLGVFLITVTIIILHTTYVLYILRTLHYTFNFHQCKNCWYVWSTIIWRNMEIKHWLL